MRISLKFIWCFLLIKLSLFEVVGYSQNNKFLDSLKKINNPVEKTRYAMGTIEEIGIVEDRVEFLKLLNVIIKQSNPETDELLISYCESQIDVYREFYNLNYPEKVKEHTNRILEFKKKEDLILMGYNMHMLAQTHYNYQKHALAFETYYSVFKLYKTIGFENVPSITKFLHDFALFQYYFKDYKQMLNLMKMSLKYTAFNKNHEIQRYNNIGVAYTHLKKTDSALHYFNKTYNVAKKYNNQLWLGIVDGNIGNVYFSKNNFNEALKYYLSQKEIYSKANDNLLSFTSYVNLAKTYLKLNNLDSVSLCLKDLKSILYTLKPVNFGDVQLIEQIKSDYYSLKVDYLTNKEDYYSAFIYKDSLYNSKRFLNEKYNSVISKLSSDKLEIQENQIELEEIHKQKTNQSIIYITTITIIIIIVGVAYFYMHIYRLKKKRQQERLIEQTKISALEMQNAERDLKVAKNEMKYFISKINEQNTIISQFENELSNIKINEAIEREQIENSLEKLKDVKILTEEDWVEFQKNFEMLFPDFVAKLKSYSPSITGSEARYLMLLKIGLSHKEMSRTLGVSDGTVRVTWNRVRKKLNGTLEDTPLTLINKLDSSL